MNFFTRWRKPPPWTQDETERLFHKNRKKEFNPEDFGRTEQECARHMADVLCMIFGAPGDSPLLGIQHVVGRFYDGREVHPSEAIIGPRLSETILTEFLIERKAWTGLGVTKSQCEHHFWEILGSICEDRSVSMEELFADAIDKFYVPAQGQT